MVRRSNFFEEINGFEKQCEAGAGYQKQYECVHGNRCMNVMSKHSQRPRHSYSAAHNSSITA